MLGDHQKSWLLNSLMKAHPFLRVSSSEVEKKIEEERKKWQAFRLQQVRAQSRNEARRILENVKKEEKNQKKKIQEELLKKYDEEKENKLHILEEKYQESLDKFGEAHKNAHYQDKLMQAHNEQVKEDRNVAIKRGTIASKKLAEQKEERKKLQSEQHKRNVLLKEKRRAQKIASRPTPPRLKIKRKTPTLPPKKVVFYEAGTYATRSYEPKVPVVKKEPLISNEPRARDVALHEAKQEEEKRLQEEQKREMNEKRRIERGETARKREAALHLQSELLQELSHADHLCNLPSYSDDDIDLSRPTKEQLEKAEEKVKKVLQETSKNSELIDFSKLHEFDSESTLIPSNTESISDTFLELSSKSAASIEEASKDPTHRSKEKVPQSTDKKFQKIPTLQPNAESKSKSTEQKFESSQKELSVNFEKLSNEVGNILKKISKFSGPAHQIPLSKDLQEHDEELQTIHSNLEKLKQRNTKISKLTNANQQDVMILDKRPKKSLISIPQNVQQSSLPSPISSCTETSSSLGTTSNISSDIFQSSTDTTSGSSLTPSSCASQSNSTLTPVRYYTESLKPDGSGKRLLSKRQKFEARKKDLLQFYVQKLMGMKKEELDLVSASLVEDSGVDISSQLFSPSESQSCSSIRNSETRVSSINVSSWNSDSSGKKSDVSKKFTDLDEYPTKLSSLESTSAATPISSSETAYSSTNSNFLQSTDAENQQILKGILLRLARIQKLKFVLANQQDSLSDCVDDPYIAGKLKERSFSLQSKETEVSSALYPLKSSSSETSGFQDLSHILDLSEAALSLKKLSMHSCVPSNRSDPKSRIHDSHQERIQRGSTTPDIISSSTPSSIPDVEAILEKKFNIRTIKSDRGT